MAACSQNNEPAWYVAPLKFWVIFTARLPSHAIFTFCLATMIGADTFPLAPTGISIVHPVEGQAASAAVSLAPRSRPENWFTFKTPLVLCAVRLPPACTVTDPPTTLPAARKTACPDPTVNDDVVFPLTVLVKPMLIDCCCCTAGV